MAKRSAKTTIPKAARKAAKLAQNSVSRRGKHPNSLAAIKPHEYKKDESGNPGGRPKVLSHAYRDWLEMVNERDPQGRTNAELGAFSMGVAMLKGNVGAAIEIRKATEGDKVDVTTAGESLKGYSIVSPDDWDAQPPAADSPVPPAGVAG